MTLQGHSPGKWNIWNEGQALQNEKGEGLAIAVISRRLLG